MSKYFINLVDSEAMSADAIIDNVKALVKSSQEKTMIHESHGRILSAAVARLVSDYMQKVNLVQKR